MTNTFGDVFQSLLAHRLDTEDWVSGEREKLGLIPLFM